MNIQQSVQRRGAIGRGKNMFILFITRFYERRDHPAIAFQYLLFKCCKSK